MYRSRLVLSGCVVAVFVAAAWGQTPAGTAFTYQGQLRQSNSPVNRPADFIFKLFDAATGGTQVGADVLTISAAGESGDRHLLP